MIMEQECTIIPATAALKIRGRDVGRGWVGGNAGKLTSSGRIHGWGEGEEEREQEQLQQLQTQP